MRRVMFGIFVFAFYCSASAADLTPFQETLSSHSWCGYSYTLKTQYRLTFTHFGGLRAKFVAYKDGSSTGGPLEGTISFSGEGTMVLNNKGGQHPYPFIAKIDKDVSTGKSADRLHSPATSG